MNEFNPELLKMCLAAAVPLWIAQFRHYPHAERVAIAKVGAPILAEKGDRLLFGGPKGEPAAVFNAFARSVAASAFLPGGITVMGMHFEESVQAVA